MFKAMLLYRITNAAHIETLNSWSKLSECLEEYPEFEPTGSQWRGLGFGPFAPTVSEELVWNGAEGVNLFSLKVHERNLTAATIREHVIKKVIALEEREGRKVYRKEAAEIKDVVVAELLPKAFLKHKVVNALVIGNLLVVGASTAKLAEDFLCKLRDAMGSLAVRPLTTKLPPQQWLGDLMRKGKAEGLATCAFAKLVNESKDTVSFNGVDLSEDEPQRYLEDGFRVKELGVIMGSEMAFKLTETLIFKGIKFSDMLLGGARADADGDPAALIDADIILMTAAIRQLLSCLNNIAGEDIPEITQPEEGLRITHINNTPLEDLLAMSDPEAALRSLQEQFGGAHGDGMSDLAEDDEPATEDEDF